MRQALVVGLALVTAACSGMGTDTEVVLWRSESLPRLELSSGTSFGMCAGYCRRELSVDSLTLTLTEVAQVQELPTRIRTLPLSLADFRRIRALVDVVELTRLRGTHGCPDCADGGAEWIELETLIGPVRVTFEYGDTLAGIGPLQAELRALRDRFPR